MKLMEDVTSNKRKMKELEDNLLYRLTSTQVSLKVWSNLSTMATLGTEESGCYSEVAFSGVRL